MAACSKDWYDPSSRARLGSALGPWAAPSDLGPQDRILMAQPSSAAWIIILVLLTECWDTSLLNKFSCQL